MKYGFVNVASAIPSVRVADPVYNEKQMEPLITQAVEEGVEVMCFPELGLTGYSCQDLFRNQMLLDGAEVALM